MRLFTHSSKEVYSLCFASTELQRQNHLLLLKFTCSFTDLYGDSLIRKRIKSQWKLMAQERTEAINTNVLYVGHMNWNVWELRKIKNVSQQGNTNYFGTCPIFEHKIVKC